MLELSYYWILVFIATLGLVYWLGTMSSKIDTSAQSDKVESGSKIVDVIFEIPTRNYGEHLAIIDGVVGGWETNFTQTFVRDSISAHAITQQDYTITSSDGDYLKAIGSGRRATVVRLGKITYRIDFKRS
jgi:hypothetical protein